MRKSSRHQKNRPHALSPAPTALAGQPPAEDPALSRRPLWMPEGDDLARMPAELRQAAALLATPAYEKMVLGAANTMGRSLGASIAHLLWLELLDQHDLKKEYCQKTLGYGMEVSRGKAIDQYIKLINAKLRIGDFMIRLRALKLKESKSSPASPRRAPTEGWSGEGPKVRAGSFTPPSTPYPPEEIPPAAALQFDPSPVHSVHSVHPVQPAPGSQHQLEPWKNQEPLSKLCQEAWKRRITNMT
jgi:hypothetical protein